VEAVMETEEVLAVETEDLQDQEDLTVVDLAVEVVVVLIRISDQEQCILLNVQNVVLLVKFHLNQQKESLFFVEIVTIRKKTSQINKRYLFLFF
jgi:hypothetical protein